VNAGRTSSGNAGRTLRKGCWQETAALTLRDTSRTYTFRILGRIPDKSLKSFPLYSFDLRFLFLQTHATSYSFCSALLYTVKETGGKPDRKPHPFPMI
jgi:hypothetical protein